jgi:hypothetical protein
MTSALEQRGSRDYQRTVERERSCRERVLPDAHECRL